MALVGLAPAAASSRLHHQRPGGLHGAAVRHVIEVMLENHTEDSLFASFPGSRALPSDTTLADPALPGGQAAPLVAPPNEGDVQAGLNNSRSAELTMMDRRQGRYRMDGYARFPGEGRSALTTFAPSVDPNLQALAHQFELADRNFQPAIAPTLPNVLEALTATTNGELTNRVADTGRWRSIFDELAAAHRSFRIYSGVPTSIYEGTVWTRLLPPGHADDLTGTTRLFADLRSDRLPAFSFVRPGVGYSEEPPEDVGQGDTWLGQIVAALAASRAWSSTVLFVTYDEGGGFYDHVSPPVVAGSDGYGTRTPLVIVSPWARRGVFDARTTNLSVLAFVQHLWSLPPLDHLNAVQNDLAGAFDFRTRPLPPPRVPVAPRGTIGFYGRSVLNDVEATLPGRTLTVHLRANTPGLALDPAASGVVALSVVPPAGTTPPPAVPRAVRLVHGRATLRLRFARPGYYRLRATGPGGRLGWLTVDVGVNANTP